jgi:outer membrane protein TolC
LPLYDFGGYRAEVIESQTRLRAEEIRLEAVRETIRNEIARAYAEIHEVEGRLTVIEKEILKAEVKLKSVRARREQGLVGPLTVLEAESHLLDLQQSLADARHERPLKYAALQKMAVGVRK